MTSSYDKKPIDAWIATPPNFDPAKKYPLILEIHGGPFASYGPVFSTDVQQYTEAGYVVVYANRAARRPMARPSPTRSTATIRATTSTT